LAAGLENASEMEGCFGSTENVNKMMKWKEQNRDESFPLISRLPFFFPGKYLEINSDSARLRNLQDNCQFYQNVFRTFFNN
jgi:hypothetical protein